MRPFLRLLALLFLIAALSGCGWLKPRESADYKEARSSKPLAIPAGLDSPRDNSALVIPESATGKNQTEVSAAPPAVAINEEPIVPVPTALAPDAAFSKLAAALRTTTGLTVSEANEAKRTLKVTTEVAQARRSWWSRLTGRDGFENDRQTRTVAVLAGSGGGSAVVIQDARGNSDAAARRILIVLRQALR